MQRHRSVAFTLVELIVVMGIISVLMALILPAIQRVRETANRSMCSDKLRQISIAISLFENEYRCLPPRLLVKTPVQSIPFSGVNLLAQILPYTEHSNLWETVPRALQLDVIAYRNPPHVANSALIALFSCPSDSRMPGAWMDVNGMSNSYASYVGVLGSNFDNSNNPLRKIKPGVFAVDESKWSAVRDGLSNTLLMGERPPPTSGLAGWWYSSSQPGDAGIRRMFDSILAIRSTYVYGSYPCYQNPNSNRYGPGDIDNPCDAYHFWSMHPGGSNFAFCDGSVRFLRYSIGEASLSALATASGGEPTPELD